MTTPRENLLSTLGHRPAEWVPFTVHCDPYNQPNRRGMDQELAADLGEKPWGSKVMVTRLSYLNLDIMDWFGMPAVRITRRNVEIEQTTAKESSTRGWHTPAGDLREVIRGCHDDTGAVSSNWTEHMAKGPQEPAARTAS